jgi:phospholipase C
MNEKFVRRIGFVSLLCALLGLGACGGAGGSTSQNHSGTPTLVFSANTNTIPSGQSVTLSWNATNSTNVTITASSGSTSRTVISSTLAAGTAADKPTQTTTYTAVATGSGGSSSPQTARVQVVQPVQPQIATFTASPMTLNSGQTTTITWTTTNATSVTITPPVPQPDDTGSLSTSGSAIVPVISTTTFTINASGPGGAATPKSVTVEVPLTLTLNASPTTIITEQSTAVTLTWQVTGGPATALSIDNGVCSSCALPQGTATVTPTSTTTYTATATAVGGNQITTSATVTVSSGSSTVIKHIFFLLQENRSFDMYFGLLGPYRKSRLSNAGIPDSQTVNGFDPNATLTNRNANNVHVKPFHEATVCTENLSPAWDESHHDTSLTGGDSAWDNPPLPFTDSAFGMAGFLETTGSVPQNWDPDGTRAMGYYDSTDLPYYYDLATFFATSDSWHSPILANTVPNRMYLMAATSFGHEYPDFSSSHPKYSAPTIFRAMNTANVSWLYYYKDGIFLANFLDFQDPKIEPKTFPVSDLMSRLTGADPDKALPEVIFIDSASGGSGLDEHPDNNVQSGAFYVKSIIDALMQSNAWQDSVFILTYDEGGGLYDHVPPFAVPPPDQYAPGQCLDPNNGSSGYCAVRKLGGQTNKIGVQQFGLTGFRVPLVVISPYAKPNYVSHTPRDYTAILAFIEETFNVQPLTARDAYWKDPSRDMSEFFDFTKPALETAPGGVAWPSFLSSQPIGGLCDQTKEAGPTF